MMRSRTLLNLSLLGVVTVLVLITVLNPGKSPPPTETHLTPLKQADVMHILLQQAQGNDIELEKQNGHWWMRKPYNLPANNFRADSATKLVEETSYSQHPLSKADEAKYGLDKPALRITYNNSVTIALGGNAPLQQRRYAQVGETLHTINDSYNYSLAESTTSFIGYALLPPQSKLTRLELPDFTLLQEKGEWKTQPAQKLASGDDLNEMISYWENAQSLEVFTSKDRSPKGNTIRVSLVGQDKPISFLLQRNGDDTSLIRTDLGIGYRLSHDSAEQLLSLPKPEKPAAPVKPVTKK